MWLVLQILIFVQYKVKHQPKKCEMFVWFVQMLLFTFGLILLLTLLRKNDLSQVSQSHWQPLVPMSPCFTNQLLCLHSLAVYSAHIAFSIRLLQVWLSRCTLFWYATCFNVALSGKRYHSFSASSCVIIKSVNMSSVLALSIVYSVH